MLAEDRILVFPRLIASHDGPKSAKLCTTPPSRHIPRAGLAGNCTDYEPDAVLRCGARLSDDAIAIPDPLTIVEVLTPSTGGIDRAFKLQEYFRLPTQRHYLIVWADKQQIVHHRRGDDGGIETQIVAGGEVRLDPPGITIIVEDVYIG